MAEVVKASKPEGVKVVQSAKLPPGRFQQPGVFWQTHECNVPAGTTLDELCSPGYFAGEAVKINTGDVILFRYDDQSMFGALYVSNSAPFSNLVKVHLLWHRDLTPAALDQYEDASYDIMHMGLHDGWRVIRKADKQQMPGKFKDYQAAKDYVVNLRGVTF